MFSINKRQVFIIYLSPISLTKNGSILKKIKPNQN